MGYSCLQTLVLRGSTVRHWVRLLRSCIGQERERVPGPQDGGKEDAGASGNNTSTKRVRNSVKTLES